MATAYYDVIELRFKINPDFTEVTVVCGPTSDGTLGVQGAHTKAFPKDRKVVDIITNEIVSAEYLLWG